MIVNPFNHSFGPQDAVALGVHLQGDAVEEQLEHRQIIRRSLDHDLLAANSLKETDVRPIAPTLDGRKQRRM